MASAAAEFTLPPVADDTSLLALFLSSFLAATLLPGGSEAVLFGVIRMEPGLLWPAIAVATTGNTLGGMSSWLIGRLLPQRQFEGDDPRHARARRALEWARAHGAPVLLLAWAPLVGDALCVAAGWLRLGPWVSLLYMALGKLARYVAIAVLAG